MSDLFIIFVAVVGFVAWAFFQNLFVSSSINPNSDTRLIFPIVVPIFAGLLASVGYVIWLRHSPASFLASSLKAKPNLIFLAASSAGLAIAYFLYPLLIVKNSKNIALIPILNTLLFVLIAFFVRYENDQFILKFKARPIEVTGAVVTLVGVILMKYGPEIFER